MEKNQKINCSVVSCKYNNKQDQECKLETIVVLPKSDCHTEDCDESMCGSYQYTENTEVVKKY